MNLSRLIKLPFYILIYTLSFLIPRDKNIWLFIGWHKGAKGEIFADNCKFLFLHTANYKKTITSIWISKDKKFCKFLREQGYNAYSINEIKGIYYLLRGGFTFIDALLPQDYNFFLKGTKIIQLWHTRGLKKLKIKKSGLFSLPYNYLFSPSPFVSKNLLSQFNVASKNIFVTGSPRTDIFFKKIPGSDIGVSQNLKDKLKRLREEGIQKFILYMPTFRRGSLKFELEKIIDVSQFNSLMEEQKIHFFIKLHPKLGQQKMSFIKSKNITFIEESDIHPLLKYFDILVTDYSSVFVDFLLLDKPIIFFPYDLNEYRKKEGLALKYEKYTPGPKVFNSDELLEIIKKTLQGEDRFSEKRKKIKNLYYQYSDGKSSERIVDIISKKTNKKL